MSLIKVVGINLAKLFFNTRELANITSVNCVKLSNETKC
jgi:hypothetical protein